MLPKYYINNWTDLSKYTCADDTIGITTLQVSVKFTLTSKGQSDCKIEKVKWHCELQRSEKGQYHREFQRSMSLLTAKVNIHFNYKGQCELQRSLLQWFFKGQSPKVIVIVNSEGQCHCETQCDRYYPISFILLKYLTNKQICLLLLDIFNYI